MLCLRRLCRHSDSVEETLLQHLNNQFAKGVTALAVMLIAMLVVQAPVAMVDRALHASGQTHAANAFAGPLAVDLADHDHDVDHHVAQEQRDDDAVKAAVLAPDDEPDPSSKPAHHHHDGHSLLGLAATLAVTTPWVAIVAPWPGRSTSLVSAEQSPQKRPPKARLEHVA